MGKWQEFIEKIGKNRFIENEHAKLYIEVEKIDDLIDHVKDARSFSIPIFIIGSGTFPLNQKGQIDGLLIKNNCRKFDIFSMSGKMKEGQLGIDYKIVQAESGTLISQLVRFTIEEGLSGLEYQLGLPGSIGGAIYTNALYRPKNIYINDIVEKLKILDKNNEITEVGSDYFASHGNVNSIEAKEIILSAFFRLVPENKSILWERANEAVAYREKYKKQ